MDAGCTRLRLIVSVIVCFISMQVQAQLKADFTSNTTSGCPPLIVAFQSTSSGTITSYQWDLGNGTKSTLKDPVATYFDPGTYTVTLTVTDASGKATVTKKNYITVYAKPIADFDISNTSGCFPLNVSMKDKSKSGSGSIATRTWDFGDGTLSNETSPSHTYTNAGVFDVTLSVTNSNGCSNILTKDDVIIIEGGVTAGFEIASLNVCKSPASVTFKNTSTGSADSLTYSWKFGDGGTATEKSPVHNYVNQGNYTVQLTAKTPAGCTDTASLPVSISFPQSSFTTSASTCTNQNIQFTNTSAPLPVNVKWSFGDGTTSTEINPVKAYSKAGTYKVKLVNYFSDVCKDSVTQTITVGAGVAPAFVTNDTSSCAPPYAVHFTNKTAGAVQSYRWDFGDGTFDVTANPVHTYNNYGHYTVKLTAMSASGCQTETSKESYIDIEAIKITSFNNLPDSGCRPLTVKPTANFTKPDGIVKYTWYFGDGATSTEATPTHVYTKDGFYNVKLVVLTKGGCKDSLTYNNAVLVGHPLNSDFKVVPNHICANETTELINITPDKPIHFVQWNFGPINGASSDSIHEYKPTDTGWIKLSLTTYNYGCADTIEKDSALYVQPPVAKLSSLTNCDNKLSVNFGDSSLGSITRLWTFGDGKTSTTKNPIHAYTTPGTYSVKLQVNNGTCTDTTTATIHVINEKGKLVLSDAKLCHTTPLNATIAEVDSLNIKNTRWDFGEGGAATLPGVSSSHVYATTGNFKIAATMTDLNGCTYDFASPDSISVYGPFARFSSPKTGYCQNDVVTLTSQSTDDGTHAITNYTWDFGDSSVMNYKTAPFTHPYTDTGSFTIKLTVTDTYGCVDSSRRINYIYVGHPYALFNVEDSIACPNTEVKFNNISTGKNLTYNWLFGDGDSSKSVNPRHTYLLPGNYIPQLFVTDENGCTSSYKLPYSVIVSNPKARFVMSDSFATCPPLQVKFTNTSANFSSYTWDFGDGGNSTVDSPSHIYTYPGNYAVKLITTGFGSCADTLTKHILIKGPTGQFSYDSTPVCYPAVTAFSVATTTSTAFLWDYDDGNTQSSVAKTSTHTYEPGFYMPKVILSDAAGCKVPIKGKDSIEIFSVTANATTGNLSTCDTRPFTFTDASTTNDNITANYWYFGDGDSAKASTVKHGYDTIGAYTIKMIAETFHGCKDTFEMPQPLRVVPSPALVVTGDSTGCVNGPVNFVASNSVTDTSSVKYIWNFGTGDIQGGSQGSYAYTEAGQHAANITAVNSTGCTDSMRLTVDIHSLPSVNIKADSVVCQNSAAQLTASGASTYTWSSAQPLSCEDCAVTLASPAASDLYVVEGKDDYGCAGSDSLQMRVIVPASITASSNDTLCMGQSAKLSASGALSYKWSPAIYLDKDDIAQPTFFAKKDTLINYTVTGFTENKCFSDSKSIVVKTYPIPSITATAKDVTMNVGSSVILGMQSSADITSWTWSPQAGLSNPSIPNPVAKPIQTTTFQCVASNGGGCVSRDEIVVHVICNNTNVFVPNTFSPNNDGSNDRFYVRGTGLFTIKSFRIFNRWGQLIFETLNTTANDASGGWDGSYKGQLQGADVYVYTMEILCQNNSVIPVKGNITLLR